MLEAKRRVEGGEKWSTVAKELSDDPASKEQGGKLLGVTKGQQDPKLDAAVFAAVEKKVAGPIKTDAGYYVFRVTKVTKASKQSLEQSKQGIQQLLVSQKQQKELDQFSTNFRNDWRARTDCAKDYTIADCRNGREPNAGRHAAGAAGPEGPDPGIDRRRPARARRDRQQPRRRQRQRHRDRCRAAGAAAGGQFGLPGGAGATPSRLRSRSAALRSRAPRGAVPAAYRPACRTTPGGAGGQPVPPQQGGQQQRSSRPRRPSGSGRSRARAAEPRTSGCARRCSSSTRSPAACGASVPGTASRTSAASSRTPSRRPTSWPTRRTPATTRSCSTSSATCCSRSTSCRCCSRSAAPATSRRWPRRHARSSCAATRTSSASEELAGLPTDATHGGRGEAELGRDQAARGPGAGASPRRLPALTYARKRLRGADAGARSPRRRSRGSSGRARRAGLRRAHHGSDELYEAVGELLLAVVDVARRRARRPRDRAAAQRRPR